MYISETSAKSGDNVERLFVDTAKFLYQKYRDRLHKMIDEDTMQRRGSSRSGSMALDLDGNARSKGVIKTQDGFYKKE